MPHSVGLLTNLAKVKLPHSVGFSYKIKLRVPHCVGLVTQVICEGAPLRGGGYTRKGEQCLEASACKICLRRQKSSPQGLASLKING